MVIGIGVDIVEVRRMCKAMEGNEALQNRVFTPEEIRYCCERKNKFQHFAGRFAAKEAALKALGTGWQQGIRWKDVEVKAGELGKPELTLHGRALETFQNSGANRVLLTITHAEQYALAMVIMEG
ncbi:MAG: holo-ACP synthase [Acidobacteriota bacterium]